MLDQLQPVLYRVLALFAHSVRRVVLAEAKSVGLRPISHVTVVFGGFAFKNSTRDFVSDKILRCHAHRPCIF